MRFLLYLGCFYTCRSINVQENNVIVSEGNLESLKKETFTPSDQSNNVARNSLENIILEAQKKQLSLSSKTQNSANITLKDIFSGANIRIGGDRPLQRQGTTVAAGSTEQPSTTTTTPPPTTTTKNPANFPKTGDIKLLVENIVHSGHMIHWSAEQTYLAISDLWGQKYLRFAERDETTTTEAPATTTTTTPSSRQATTVTTATVTTSTAKPLPYEIKTLRIPKDVVFLIQPQKRTEGAYPAMVPVNDVYNYTEKTDEVILAFNQIFHLASWDLESEEMNMTTAQWFNSRAAEIEIRDFMIPSPAWVDPFGQLFTGTHDVRPFEKAVTHSIFSFFQNTFEPYETFQELSLLSYIPTGMAWGTDNTTLYLADGQTKNITKCVYDYMKGDVTSCDTVFDVEKEISATAVPQGMATDENNHVWVALSDKDKGTVIEIDPESNTVVSTIDVEDPDLVDIVFAGEDLDFLYVLSKKSLYKMTGLGINGMLVPDFKWTPELKKKRSLFI